MLYKVAVLALIGTSEAFAPTSTARALSCRTSGVHMMQAYDDFRFGSGQRKEKQIYGGTAAFAPTASAQQPRYAQPQAPAPAMQPPAPAMQPPAQAYNMQPPAQAYTMQPPATAYAMQPPATAYAMQPRAQTFNVPPDVTDFRFGRGQWGEISRGGTGYERGLGSNPGQNYVDPQDAFRFSSGSVKPTGGHRYGGTAAFQPTTWEQQQQMQMQMQMQMQQQQMQMQEQMQQQQPAE